MNQFVLTARSRDMYRLSLDHLDSVLSKRDIRAAGL